jgi:hypothetical protein
MFASCDTHNTPHGEHKQDGARLGWIMQSISTSWNCLLWFAILTLGVAVLNLGQLLFLAIFVLGLFRFMRYPPYPKW